MLWPWEKRLIAKMPKGRWFCPLVEELPIKKIVKLAIKGKLYSKLHNNWYQYRVKDGKK